MSKTIQNNKKSNNSHNKENINFHNNYSEKKASKNRPYNKLISNQPSMEVNTNQNNQVFFNDEHHHYAKHFNEKEKSNSNLLNNNFNENIENKDKDSKYITIEDIIGEKCQLNLDLLNLFFNNYEQSKTSKKTMGVVKSYGVNTYQGIVRNYNEDRVSIIINMNKPKNYNKKIWPKISFFGIYDGHGGEGCSEYLRDNLHKLICNNNEFFPEDVPEAIKLGFQKAEKDFINNYALSDKKEIIDKSGSCAIIILIVDRKVYIANVGDSRCLLSMENGKKYIEVTKDHKPNSPNELKRIKKYGGNIYQSETVINNVTNAELNGKILIGPYRVVPGRLSVSRTIGDVEAKLEKFGGNPNVIIPEPEIFFYDLKKIDIDFFILGCDGIYDQISSNEILDCAWMVLNGKDNMLIKECKDIHHQSGFIVDFILKSSLARKSFDNVTCLFIALKELGMGSNEQIDKNDRNNFKNSIKNEKINNYMTPNISPITPIPNSTIKEENKNRNNYEKINMMARKSGNSSKNTHYGYNANDNSNNRNQRNHRNSNKFLLSNHRSSNNSNNKYQSFNTEYRLRSMKLNNTSNDSSFPNEKNDNNITFTNNRFSHNRIQTNPLTYSKKTQSFTKNGSNHFTNISNNGYHNNYKQITKPNISSSNFSTYSGSSSYNKKISQNNDKKNYDLEDANRDLYLNNKNMVSKFNYNNQFKNNGNKINKKILGSANNSVSLGNINNINNIKNNLYPNATSHRYLLTNLEERNSNSNYSSSVLNNRVANENIPLKKNYLNLNQQYKYQSQIMNNNSIYTSYSTDTSQNNNNQRKQKKNLSLNRDNNNNNLYHNNTNIHNNSVSASNNNLVNNRNNNGFSSRMKRNITTKIRQEESQKPLPNSSFRLNQRISGTPTSPNNLSTQNLQLSNNYYSNYANQNMKSNLYKEIGKNYTNYTYNSNKGSSIKYKYNNYQITEINNTKKDYLYRDNNINDGNKYNIKYNVQQTRKRGDNISENNYKISKNYRHNKIKKENNNDYIEKNRNNYDELSIKNVKYNDSKYYNHYY